MIKVMVMGTMISWCLTFSHFLNPSIKKNKLKEKEQIEKSVEMNKPP